MPLSPKKKVAKGRQSPKRTKVHFKWILNYNSFDPYIYRVVNTSHGQRSIFFKDGKVYDEFVGYGLEVPKNELKKIVKYLNTNE
jgi:hypothetical protein